MLWKWVIQQLTNKFSVDSIITFVSGQYTLMDKIKLLHLLLCIFYNIPYTRSSCSPVSTTPRLPGYFCTAVDATVLPSVLEHECTLTCAQTSTCAATNYNTSDNTCSLLPTTCPRARNDPDMVYAIFNADRDNCMEWQHYSPRMAVDERWPTIKHGGNIQLSEQHRIARLVLNGNIYPGYLVPFPNKRCFTANEIQEHHTQDACEVLRVREGCTLAFVSYTVGNIIPHDAVASEGTAGGTMRYIAVIEDPDYGEQPIVGYYIVGTPNAVYQYYGVRFTSQMQLIIVL